jgi:hypothetical protein
MKLLLTKMKTQIGSKIDYFFECPEKDIHVNTFIGKQISLKWNGGIACSKCLKQTDKSFGQGFCYSCFISAPEASPCILHTSARCPVIVTLWLAKTDHPNSRGVEGWERDESDCPF